MLILLHRVESVRFIDMADGLCFAYLVFSEVWNCLVEMTRFVARLARAKAKLSKEEKEAEDRRRSGITPKGHI
jgi:hypothetical protein